MSTFLCYIFYLNIKCSLYSCTAEEKTATMMRALVVLAVLIGMASAVKMAPMIMGKNKTTAIPDRYIVVFKVSPIRKLSNIM